MPLYAGVCETNITPPAGGWMSGYGGRPTGSVAVHDELFARAVVLDDGASRVALIAADLIAFPPDIVERVRRGVVDSAGVSPDCAMLHATHTHGGPYIGIFRAMGHRDEAYVDVLGRKLIGVVRQAASDLRPAQLVYGESAAQIGVNRRQSRPDGSVILGNDYGGPVSPLVQTLCVNGIDGRSMAILFCHACHPTTMGGDNLEITAEWPGAAVNHLKSRFTGQTEPGGFAAGALAIALQGCCGDINPIRRSTWDAVNANGAAIADAAHAARWNAHGRLADALSVDEMTVDLPLLPPPPTEECDSFIAHWESVLEQDRSANAPVGRLLFDEGRIAWARAAGEYSGKPDFAGTQPFTIQRLTLGGVHVLGFPAEMFVQYQLDFSAQCREPVMSLGYTNGCWNYVPTAAEYVRGGYEVNDAHKYYGTLMFAPECEKIIRAAAYRLLGIDDPVLTPYPLHNGRPLIY